MLSYYQIRNKPRILRSLTSLNPEEFDQLINKFRSAWEAFVNDNYIKNKDRKRQYGGGRIPKLRSIEEKLFFILFYFKVYPLQEVIAFIFEMSQSQANEWIHKLSKVLNMALGYEKQLPERNPKNLDQVLSECPALEFMIDGTERSIQRPKDNEKQKKYYSGKKKAHTKKNNLITDAKTKKVKYLSKTYEGKKHDKPICDEEEYEFPKGSTLWKDTGFQGYEPKNTTTIQPKKKPRGKELSEEDKLANKAISSIRVGIEHVIGSIKVCRIVKDIFRNYKENYDDLVMENACGLHNFKVEYRYSSL